MFTVYFQHHTGDIRYMKYTNGKNTNGQKWIGGGITETVASNAKNSTPISAVSYAANGTQFVSPTIHTAITLLTLLVSRLLRWR